MTSFTSKVFVGVGAAWLAIGAVSLSIHLRTWGVFSILVGAGYILTAISANPRSLRQKVIRGLGFGFLGAAVVFFVIWIMQSKP
jgi:hypothetical protein